MFGKVHVRMRAYTLINFSLGGFEDRFAFQASPVFRRIARRPASTLTLVSQPLALPAGDAHALTLGRSLAFCRDVCKDDVHILKPALGVASGKGAHCGLFYFLKRIYSIYPLYVVAQYLRILFTVGERVLLSPLYLSNTVIDRASRNGTQLHGFRDCITGVYGRVGLS